MNDPYSRGVSVGPAYTPPVGSGPACVYVLPRHFWLQGWQPYKVNSQGRLPVKLFPYQYEDTMAQHVLGLPQQCVNIHSPFFGGNLVLFLPRQTNVLFGLQEVFQFLYCRTDILG